MRDGKSVRNRCTRRSEDGASAVEYGLLLTAIAAAIVLIVFLFGGAVHDLFSGSCDSIKSHASVAGDCSG
jgi:pilus assembly protein Flp/PilA